MYWNWKILSSWMLFPAIHQKGGVCQAWQNPQLHHTPAFNWHQCFEARWLWHHSFGLLVAGNHILIHSVCILSFQVCCDSTSFNTQKAWEVASKWKSQCILAWKQKLPVVHQQLINVYRRILFPKLTETRIAGDFQKHHSCCHEHTRQLALSSVLVDFVTLYSNDIRFGFG